MLHEYEQILVAEILLEFNKLNGIHLQLFCDEIKDNQEKYARFKEEAKKTMDRILGIAETLIKR